MGTQKSGAAPVVPQTVKKCIVGADARIRPERLPLPQTGMASPLHPRKQKKSPLPNVSTRGFLWCAVQDSNL